MCVLLITRLLRGVGRWARKPVNHTSWVAVVTPTDRPKSVRNCCLIELFCGVVCVVTLSLWHFCWYRGFCHRTGSDLLLFVSVFFCTIKFFHLFIELLLHTKWLNAIYKQGCLRLCMFANTSVLYIYNWNIVACDVKQPFNSTIHLSDTLYPSV